MQSMPKMEVGCVEEQRVDENEMLVIFVYDEDAPRGD